MASRKVRRWGEDQLGSVEVGAPRRYTIVDYFRVLNRGSVYNSDNIGCRAKHDGSSFSVYHRRCLQLDEKLPDGDGKNMGAGDPAWPEGYVSCLSAEVGVFVVSRSIEKSGVFGAGESADPRGCGVDDVTPSGGGGFQLYCFPALYSSSSF